MGFLSFTRTREKRAKMNDNAAQQNRTQTDAPEGSYPARVGDSFCDGRYQVKSHLGSGRYSSVWLIEDI